MSLGNVFTVQNGPLDSFEWNTGTGTDGGLVLTENSSSQTVYLTSNVTVLNDNVATGTVNINGTDTMAAHTIAFTAGASGYDVATFGSSVATLTFKNPSALLDAEDTKATGSGDTFTFTTLDSGFNAAVTVGGTTTPSVVNLNTALNLGKPSSSTGAVSFDATTINLVPASARMPTVW